MKEKKLPKNQQFVCLAYSPYDQPFWLRSQSVMHQISLRYPVLYINPPEPLFPQVLKPSRWNWLLGNGRWEMNREKGLSLFTPIQPIPFVYRKPTKPYNEWLVSQSLIRLARKCEIKNPILWMGMGFHNYKVENVFNEVLTVYDCPDKYGIVMDDVTPEKAEEIRNFERYLAKRADIVFVTNPALKNDLSHLNQNIHVVPNGIEAKFIDPVFQQNAAIPDDLKNLKKPIIGCIGTIRPKVDLDLLLYLTRERPKYSIVLIGPLYLRNQNQIEKFKTLSAMENVYYLGPCHRSLAVNYVKGFDVAIHPLMRNDYCAHQVPNKVVLFLSLGKPIVMFRQSIPMLHEEFFFLADTYEEYVTQVDEALNSPNDARILEGKRRAETLTWEHLTDVIISALAETFQKKGLF